MINFHIKICGITQPADARMAAEAGADAIGMNFYEGSPRVVDAARATEIAAALPADVARVGVFVNAAPNRIADVCRVAELDLVQLHGDESPQEILRLTPLPVMRVFRIGDDGLASVERYLDACRRLGCLPARVLVDARHDSSYGGTGEMADWDAAARYVADAIHPPLVLAGGLTAENVAEAIRRVRPAAVDVASGVESSPGHKDQARVRAFVTAARGALQQTARLRAGQ